MRIQKPATDDTGATAIEYSLLIAGVAAVLVAAVVLLGGNVAHAFAGAGNALSGSDVAAGPDSQSADATPSDNTPADTTPDAPAAYAGPQPRASYAQNMGNGGTFTLPAIAGITYSAPACSAGTKDGCDRDKSTFTGTGIKVDKEWSKEHRSATFTIAWTIAATDTTAAANGTLHVTLS